MKKVVTLSILAENNQILLAMKKRGFGVGRWNGFGGKVEAGETIEEAAQREIFEESGLEATEISARGVLDFDFPERDLQLEVHVFKILKYSGTAQESEEMKPQWFSLDAIPYDEMWADDIHWLPLFLQDDKFSGKFILDNQDQIIDYQLNKL